MTVHIQQIQIQNLGPLDSFTETLGQVNLIYGRNESGKTYLVEFLLRSLFQHARNWELRDPGGKGSIQVQGLGPEAVFFSPERGPKIESFWQEAGQGLPLNLARFLVVKGGELALSAASQGGVGRDVLKRALTSQALLDGIWDSIKATVRQAELEGSLIQGSSRPPLTTRTDLKNEIQSLAELLETIDESYSRGPAWEIEKQIESVQGQLELQRRAKCHLAYQASARLADLDRQRASLPLPDLQELRDSLRDLDVLEREIKKLKSKQKELEARSQDYLWLDSARQVWDEKGLDHKQSPPSWLGIAGLGGVGLGLAALVLAQFTPAPGFLWLGGGLALAGFGLSLYYGLRHRQWLETLDDSRERQAIQREYQEKFQTDLSSLTDLRAQLAHLAEPHHAAQATQNLLAEKASERELQRLALENRFVRLVGESVPPRKWAEQMVQLNQRSQALDEEIVAVKLELSKLDVPQEHHLEDPPSADYDPVRIAELEKELRDLTSDLSSYQSDLETLKGQAAGRIGVEIGTPWREVLHALQDLQRSKENQYKELTALIVAQIGLTEVLGKLRQEEDLKINQAINAQPVSALLRQITGRYRKLSLDADQLYVEDDFSVYPLSDLSTGAREQVQLALRLGIASQLCGGNPLFLILDDAFQHSDWQRRESLVRTMLGLAQSGWQVCYLTMDDHIRELFLKGVKPVLKKGFKLIELD